MTPLATTRDVLFVPQGSSLSHVELLTWNISAHPSQRKGAWSHSTHDEQARKVVQVFGPQLEKYTKYKPEDPEVAVGEDVSSRGLQQCDMSLRWLSANGSEDLEFYLGVCPDMSPQGICIVG
jgi:hypothetical protein